MAFRWSCICFLVPAALHFYAASDSCALSGSRRHREPSTEDVARATARSLRQRRNPGDKVVQQEVAPAAQDAGFAMLHGILRDHTPGNVQDYGTLITLFYSDYELMKLGHSLGKLPPASDRAVC
jgi:hypothetical protein